MHKLIKWIPVAVLLAITLTGAGCSTVVYDMGESYMDSDAAIERDIVTLLRNDDLTGSYMFGVSAQGGTVILRGSVPNEMIRVRAIGIASSVTGVGEIVADQLRGW